MMSSMSRRRARVIVLASSALGLACTDSTNRANDTAAVAVASDSSGHAVDVALTPAQLAKVHVDAVTLAPFRTSVQTTGTVAFTGTLPRTGAGQSPAAASSAQRSHGSATSGGYSTNGLHSPHPAAPSTSAPSRTVMPRNRVVSGIE